MSAVTEPVVSVIIPAYCCASTISFAIESVLRQDFPLEIVVINDRSPDNLDEVMAQYAKHPQISYYHNVQNLGVAKTRNRGVALARGAVIAFLDADDIWADGKLARQTDAMWDSGAVLCCTARELMTPDGACTGRVIPVKPCITYDDLLRHNSICCSSVLLRADIARAFPMHNDDDSHEDYICWLEILQKYGIAVGINEPLVKYRLSSTGKSGSKWKSAIMTFRAYRHMGFSVAKSLACFTSYALHGVQKYWPGRRGSKT